MGKWLLRAGLVAGLVIGLVIGLVALLARRGQAPERTAEAAAPATEAAALPQARFEALGRAPRAKLEAKTAEGPVDPACQSLWTELRDLDLGVALADTPRAESLPRAERCGRVPPELEAAHGRFAEDCRIFFGPRDRLSPGAYADSVAACQASLGLYRAELTDWMTRELLPEDISDLRVLSDKLLARFEKDPETAARIAERMLELDPGLTPAAKAAAVSRFFDAQKRAAGKPHDPLWRRMDDAAGKFERMDGAKPADAVEMQLMGALMRSGADPATLVGGGEAAASRHPGLANGPYYAAWGEYRRGNLARAREWLTEALRRNPADARLLETKERLERGEADPFRAVLSTSLSPGA